jgi:hypothetical protein
MQLFVAKDVAASTGEGTLATTTTVPNGCVVVTNLRGLILDAANLPAGLDAFKLVANSGGTLIHSDVVSRGNVRKFHITAQAAETQQTDYVGWNGTTGEIETLAANTIYTIRLSVLGVTKADFMQQLIKEGFYKSGSTAPSQYDVALGLQKSLVANFSREPERTIAFEKVASGTRTALATGAGTVTFVHGSKYVTFNTDIDDATGNAALAVGELLAPAVGLTAGVYKVTAINTTTNVATIDTEYQGATATVNNNAVGRVTVANIGDFGISLVGQDLDFEAGKFKSNVVSWNTQVDFDSLVTSTAAYPGIGTYQQVASLEKELQADEYIFRNFVEGAPVDRTQAAATLLYDMGIIEYDGVIQGGLGSDVKSPKQIVYASESNTAVSDDANTGVATTLDAIFLAWGSPVAANQDANLTA